MAPPSGQESGPPPLSDPAHFLPGRTLPLVPVDHWAGTWYRSHSCRFTSSLHFNRKPTFRFNAPGREYGVPSLALFDRASDAVKEHLLGSISAAHNAAIEATILSTYTVNFVGIP